MEAPVDVVMAVKELWRAKSRLAGASAALGGTPAERVRAHHDLVLALAADTLAAVLATGVRSVVVVSSDPRVRTLSAGADRVRVVGDEGAGLDAAVRLGAQVLRARSGAPGALAALQADLPALRPAELGDALGAAARVYRDGAERGEGGDAAFVADHTGAGTTLLVTRPGVPPDPHFGPGSAAAHAASGALALVGAWSGLRLDVDTPDDLARARALGVGPATAAWPVTAASIVRSVTCVP